MTTIEAVDQLIANIVAAANRLDGLRTQADREDEKNLALVASILDHTACRMQRRQHDTTRSLLDEIDAGHHGHPDSRETVRFPNEG